MRGGLKLRHAQVHLSCTPGRREHVATAAVAEVEATDTESTDAEAASEVVGAVVPKVAVG